MTDAQTKVLTLSGRTFTPHVNFIFASRAQSIGVDAPLLVDDSNGDSFHVQSLVMRAAKERFLVDELQLAEAEVFVSTAATLMPMTPVALTDTISIKEVEASTAVETLWLHVELPKSVAAHARAHGADKKYKALKTSAQQVGIAFSDTEFAGLLGVSCCVFVKALGRAKEPTPANGKLIMRIEAKVAEYGADLPKLRSNVHDLAASKQIIKEAAAVRPATATSLLAPSCVRPCARPSLPTQPTLWAAPCGQPHDHGLGCLLGGLSPPPFLHRPRPALLGAL